MYKKGESWKKSRSRKYYGSDKEANAERWRALVEGGRLKMTERWT